MIFPRAGIAQPFGQTRIPAGEVDTSIADMLGLPLDVLAEYLIIARIRTSTADPRLCRVGLVHSHADWRAALTLARYAVTDLRVRLRRRRRFRAATPAR